MDTLAYLLTLSQIAQAWIGQGVLFPEILDTYVPALVDESYRSYRTYCAAQVTA